MALCMLFIFCEISRATPALVQAASVTQDSGLVSAGVGDTVTLRCFYEGDMAMHFSWYRQTLGTKPRLLSTVYKFKNTAELHDEFKLGGRWSVQSGDGINHLTIKDVQVSDSATYYCGSAHSNVVEFAEGVILSVKGGNFSSQRLIQQPVSESIQPGDSVTLNCTIHTETCAGEHSVYWFRHGAGESHPGILYTHGDRSGQCEKSPEASSPTQSCIYHLPKRNLSLSDAGTYYCAVASCGEILFGDGTQLNIKGETEGHIRMLVLLSILRIAIVLLCLTFCTVVYVKKKM